jgi:hypothetical protein
MASASRSAPAGNPQRDLGQLRGREVGLAWLTRKYDSGVRPPVSVHEG